MVARSRTAKINTELWEELGHAMSFEEPFVGACHGIIHVEHEAPFITSIES